MFLNYLKVTLRNLLRYKGYSLITIFGLALGISICLLIFLWVQFQFSYDRQHENLDHIYWLGTWDHYDEQMSANYGSPPAVGPALAEEYPEVVYATRYMITEGLLRSGDLQYRESMRMVDQEFFAMFTVPFLYGQPENALANSHTIVLSQNAAQKYFGDINPVGEMLRLDNDVDLEVTGVYQNWPANSTFGHDFFLSLELLRETVRPDYIDTWYNCSFYNFVQLADGVDYQVFNQMILPRIKQGHPESKLEPFLFPFGKIQLYHLSGEGGGIETVRMYIIIGLIILLIASINFVNLMTARSSRRSREVGMRKVVGAHKAELIRQFYFESIFHALLAALLSIGLVELMLPWFRGLMQEPGLQIDYFANPLILPALAALALITGLLSGSYPALLLSSFKPVKTLKGSAVSGRKKSLFRRVLVVTQFTASIVLVICTIFIYRQHIYMQNKDIGLNREQVFYLPMNPEVLDNYSAFKTRLLQNPQVQSVTRTTHSPTGVYWNGHSWEWEGKEPAFDPLVTYMGVSDGLLETFEMEMAAGEFFQPDMLGRETDMILINEKFAELTGIDPIVGYKLKHGDDYHTVLGVVKNFHFKPVWAELGALVMFPEPESRNRWYLFARLGGADISGTIAYIESVWQEFCPNFPYEYHFLDEDYERLYMREKATSATLQFFALLAIVISCLGLFGLAAFAAEQRTKEIGIRKVLGATVTGLVQLLSREFLLLVIIANVLALPIAWYLMSSWLQDYPYQTDLNLFLFLLVGAGMLVIALLTVSFQAVKAALSNPVKSLRYE